MSFLGKLLRCDSVSRAHYHGDLSGRRSGRFVYRSLITKTQKMERTLERLVNPS